MFSQDRHALREIFFTAWRKHKNNHLLEPLEMQLVDLMLVHPEYHVWFDHPDKTQDKYFQAANPFLHLGLHIALREQISTDRPAGIKSIFEKLLQQFQDTHEVEHQMIECLAEVLWDAQRNQMAPDEKMYLEKLLRL